MRSWPTFPGEIDIGFPMGDGPEVCRITLHDATSRVVLMELEIPFVDFWRAVRGRGRTMMTFETHPRIGDYIGATKEQKSIPIFVPRLRHINDVETKRATGLDWHGQPLSQGDIETLARIDQVLKPYEQDGWRASVADVLNWHCVVSKAIPLGAQAQLREAAGFSEDEEGTFHYVSFSRWIRPNGEVVL